MLANLALARVSTLSVEVSIVNGPINVSPLAVVVSAGYALK